MSYDPDNIFARILRGEIPCHKVYEDDETLAFMDIMPQSDGHTLVVPKVEGENIYDIPADALAAAAQERGRWEFLLTAAPLPMVHGTGSPILPACTRIDWPS